MKFKKWAASATAAVLLAAGVTVGGAAVAASAHTAAVAGNAVCQTDNGTYKVTWTVDVGQAPNGSKATITPITTGLGGSKTVNGNGEAKFEQTIPGTSKSAQVSFNISWDDDFAIGYPVLGSLTDATLKGNCLPDTPESSQITFCHQGNLLTTSKNAFYNSGHTSHGQGHESDIYPAGQIVKQGVTHSWDAQGDQSLLGTNCAPPVVVNPCEANYFTGHEDRGGLWEVTYGKQHTDTNGVPEFTNDSFGGLVAFNEGSIPSYMGAPGTAYRWLYVYGDTPDRVYTFDFADGTRVTATLTYSAEHCPQIAWVTGTTPPPAPEEISVVFPDATPPTCDAGGSLPTTPADTDKVTWAWSGGTLTATAKDGYVIVGEFSRTYTDPGAALGYQNTDSQADCYVAPPTKDDTSEVTYGEAECGETEVDVFTTVTTYTFDFDTRTGTYSEPIPHVADPVKTGTKTVEATECPLPPTDTPKGGLAETGIEGVMWLTGALALLLILAGVGVGIYEKRRFARQS